jgi:hypothetical protein
VTRRQPRAPGPAALAWLLVAAAAFLPWFALMVAGRLLGWFPDGPPPPRDCRVRRRYVTPERRSNCYAAAAWLLFVRGGFRSLRLRFGRRVRWSPHLFLETPRGNLLHFRAARDAAGVPLWFRGRLEVIHRDSLPAAEGGLRTLWTRRS